MTWTVTERDVVSHISSAADLVSVSFTPAAGSALFAFVISLDGATSAIQSISGHGTWSQLYFGEDEGPQSTKEIELWGCKVGGAPSASVITVDVNYQPGCTIQFIEVSETGGMPEAIADCIGSIITNDSYNAATESITLPGFDDTDNLTLYHMWMNGGTAGSLWDPEDGHTQGTEFDDGPWAGCAFWNEGEDTNPTVTINSVFTYTSMIGFEVKKASDDSASIIPIIQQHNRRRR